MCRLVWNLKPSTFWNIQGLSRPVQVLLYFYLYFSSLSGSAPMIHTHVRSGLARLFGARGSNHNDTSWHILNFAWNQIVFWIYFCLTRQFKIYWAQKMQGFSFKIFILSPSPPLFFFGGPWSLPPGASTSLPSPHTSAMPLHVNSSASESVYCVYADSVAIWYKLHENACVVGDTFFKIHA